MVYSGMAADIKVLITKMVFAMERGSWITVAVPMNHDRIHPAVTCKIPF
jgi:hypothetical protein